MTDIKKMMVLAFEEIGSKGVIKEVFEKKIRETIERIIGDLFSSYSEFGKSLEKKLGEKIAINLEEIDIPMYNVMIENYIRDQTTAVMNEQHKKLIDERLSKILAEEVKREWKLSEIVSEVVEKNAESAQENGWDQVSLHIEKCSSLTFIRIDPEPNKEKYQCCIDICIDNKNGSINSAEVGEYNTKNFTKDKFLVRLHNVELLIFRLYSQGCKIIIDEGECEDASYYPDPCDY
jgi:hypothetical protein